MGKHNYDGIILRIIEIKNEVDSLHDEIEDLLGTTPGEPDEDRYVLAFAKMQRLEGVSLHLEDAADSLQYIEDELSPDQEISEFVNGLKKESADLEKAKEEIRKEILDGLRRWFSDGSCEEWLKSRIGNNEKLDRKCDVWIGYEESSIPRFSAGGYRWSANDSVYKNIFLPRIKGEISEAMKEVFRLKIGEMGFSASEKEYCIMEISW